MTHGNSDRFYGDEPLCDHLKITTYSNSDRPCLMQLRRKI